MKKRLIPLILILLSWPVVLAAETNAGKDDFSNYFGFAVQLVKGDGRGKALMNFGMSMASKKNPWATNIQESLAFYNNPMETFLNKFSEEDKSLQDALTQYNTLKSQYGEVTGFIDDPTNTLFQKAKAEMMKSEEGAGFMQVYNTMNALKNPTWESMAEIGGVKLPPEVSQIRSAMKNPTSLLEGQMPPEFSQVKSLF
ncbi:hypothetical protein HY643_04050 [Candidatus Woesearchaeota archaeon]|nr:hypothetical protein [Candidatus Woesearchaeota archaeon]